MPMSADQPPTPLPLHFRPAAEADLPDLIAMLADDDLGAERENPAMPPAQGYLDAFAAIDGDPNHELVVVEGPSGSLVGMLQLTFLPYLTHQGSLRCLIEGVRIHADVRGEGLGTEFFSWAIDRARQRGCSMVQLTSDKRRPQALRFYEKLGFVASHEGFKLTLET